MNGDEEVTCFLTDRTNFAIMADQNEPGFEEALKNLESIVTKLEDPDVSLEESIRLYEEGMKLSRYCTGILDNATLRIEKINDRSDPDAESAD